MKNDGPDMTFSWMKFHIWKKKWWTRCDTFSWMKFHIWKNDGWDVTFSWMKFHIWKMMDQMWQFREWSFLYKNSLFCLFFMNEFMCMKMSRLVHRRIPPGTSLMVNLLGEMIPYCNCFMKTHDFLHNMGQNTSYPHSRSSGCRLYESVSSTNTRSLDF